MIKQKKCPICGCLFDPDASSQKYCSEACRRAGARAVRARWVQKSGHREKDRLRHRQKRETERQVKDERTAEASARREEEIAVRLEHIRNEFEKRCSAGDSHALLIREKSINGNTGRKYWELFQSCVIEEAEKTGVITETCVNGISVYSDLFADDVVQSIQDIGYIVTEVKRCRGKAPTG